jgi:hypothetical protein
VSRTTIFRISLAGRIKRVCTFQNSWRSAPYIWDKLWTKATGESIFKSWPFGDFQSNTLWNMVNDMSLKFEHRLVLVSTFDYVILRVGDRHAMARAMRTFVDDFPGDDYQTLTAQAHFLETAKPAVPSWGYAWQQTSVTDLWNKPTITPYLDKIGLIRINNGRVSLEPMLPRKESDA